MSAHPRHRDRNRRFLAAIATTAVAGVALTTIVPAAYAATASSTVAAKVAAAAPTTGALTIKPTDDAYVDRQAPTRNTGTATKVVAATTSAMDKKALLRFTVPAVPTGATVTSASLVVSSQRNQPAQVDVFALGSGAWTEKTVTWVKAPKVGARLASVKPAPGTKNLAVDLTKVVKPGTAQSFAITVPAGVSEVLSKETGASAPKLVVKWTKPAPVITPPPAPAPTTLFGSNVFREPGENYTQALARQQGKYGQLEATRVFYPGLPAAWPGDAGVSGRPVVVSFKANPVDVLAGKHDAHMKTWFATAPTDRQVNWSFFHEPEDDIERGSFTAADYRAAWAHLDVLADSVRNPRLKATPILMCWSLSPRSGRDWKDYYAGSSVVDELGWDCYNNGFQSGRYTPVESIYGAAKAAAASVGKPWGIAEMGSQLVSTDTSGALRAAWLRESATYLRSNGASWALYFDAPVGGEFRLFDQASVEAWRWAVSGS